jgi:hypothetical protein
MSDVSADLRIFPNKEMFSVDMAEVLDAAILKDGIIQGCAISETNGALNIAAGRIVVSGRMGVITAGTIPIPAISSQQTCTVVAVCDLRTDENPFYVSIVDNNGLQTLDSAKSSGDGFNVEGTLNYVVLGTVVVNPTTGLVSNWTPNAGTATAHKGKNVYQELLDKFTAMETSINNRLTWKSVQEADYQGTGFHAIPRDAKEIYVVIWIRWVSTGNTQKTSIGFHIPIEDSLWVSSASLIGHVNHWTKTNDGFVRLRLVKNNDGRFVKIHNVYQGDTDVTNSAYWRILYR